MHRPFVVLALAVLATACGVATRTPAPVVPAPAPATPAPARLAPVATLVSASPSTVGLDDALGGRLDSLVGAALADGMAPGAAVAVGRWGRLVHLRGYGRTDWDSTSARVGDATLYDLASLTKVVATTTLAMMLEEEGRLALDSSVAFYLPELAATDSVKRRITVRMLLTHTGGLEAFAPLYRTARGRDAFLAEIAKRPLRRAPGDTAIYSDWDMVLLGLAIERIAGTTLDALAAQRIWAPLGLRDTRFTPDTLDRALRARIAPTAVDTSRGGLIHGVVHDGNAWALGGVSGHAGLFSSARDLAVFCQLLLDGGTYGGTRLLRAETIARWTAPQTPRASRALGWDTPAPNSSAGRYLSARAFGHTGFTGTSLWMDPERGVFVVLLANRVHSRGTTESRHVRLRREVADAVAEAIVDAPVVVR